uniref:Uncharacterized protein n=1 Tax=Timema tahoe TaxID=61484 RepID=A0A7R9P0I7_9NEOP|nr:unnamed protein product [Timema tahoe]
MRIKSETGEAKDSSVCRDELDVFKRKSDEGWEEHDIQGNELELFDAAVKWAKAQCNKNELLENGDNLRAVLGDVIRHIRFLTMTPSEVTGSPCESDVLTCEDKLILLRRYISMNTVTPSSNVCCLKKSREKVQNLLENIRILNHSKDPEN